MERNGCIIWYSKVVKLQLEGQDSPVLYQWWGLHSPGDVGGLSCLLLHWRGQGRRMDEVGFLVLNLESHLIKVYRVEKKHLMASWTDKIRLPTLCIFYLSRDNKCSQQIKTGGRRAAAVTAYDSRAIVWQCAPVKAHSARASHVRCCLSVLFRVTLQCVEPN